MNLRARDVRALILRHRIAATGHGWDQAVEPGAGPRGQAWRSGNRAVLDVGAVGLIALQGAAVIDPDPLGNANGLGQHLHVIVNEGCWG